MTRHIRKIRGGDLMANLKSAVKRINTNETKRTRNKSVKTDMRSQIKHVEKLVTANDVEAAKVAFNSTVSSIDTAVSKGVIHKNNGNRQKTRLAKKISTLGA